MYLYSKAICGMVQAKVVKMRRYICNSAATFWLLQNWVLSHYNAFMYLKWSLMKPSGAYIFRPNGAPPTVISRSVSLSLLILMSLMNFLPSLLFVVLLPCLFTKLTKFLNIYRDHWRSFVDHCLMRFTNSLVRGSIR